MLILETPRLILRTWEPEDIAPFAAINQDPKVMQYLPKLLTQPESQQLIDRCILHFQEEGYSLNAVELKTTGEMIGFIGLMTVGFEASFTPAVEIGWRLASQYWNQGLATEGAQAVLNAAIDQHHLEEILSFTAKQNLPSCRVMEKIGLKYQPEETFNHPLLDPSDPLSEHVLYRTDTRTQS